jgi:hypothetical protein
VLEEQALGIFRLDLDSAPNQSLLHPAERPYGRKLELTPGRPKEIRLSVLRHHSSASKAFRMHGRAWFNISRVLGRSFHNILQVDNRRKPFSCVQPNEMHHRVVRHASGPRAHALFMLVRKERVMRYA